MISQNEHKNRIYDRVQMLIEGKVEDPDSETPLSKEALTTKLAELIFNANEVAFRMEMALGDLQIGEKPPVIEAFRWSMLELDIPEI